MRDQIDMLQQTPWDVLIILDACRADTFLAECDPGAETVRSPASCTRDWVRAAGPLLAERGVRYYTANSYVTRDNRRYRLGLDVAPLYERLTTPCGVGGAMTVHPYQVNLVVQADPAARQRLSKGGAIVVHYVQPHAPRLEGAPGYAATLRIVYGAARQLCAALGGRWVITSDHGELLGEQGRWGHYCGMDCDALRLVPWLAGEAPAAPAARVTVLDNLRHLGYVA